MSSRGHNVPSSWSFVCHSRCFSRRIERTPFLSSSPPPHRVRSKGGEPGNFSLLLPSACAQRAGARTCVCVRDRLHRLRMIKDLRWRITDCLEFISRVYLGRYLYMNFYSDNEVVRSSRKSNEKGGAINCVRRLVNDYKRSWRLLSLRQSEKSDECRDGFRYESLASNDLG